MAAFQFPSFDRWLDANTGIVSLLAEISRRGGLAGGVRPAAAPAGGMLVLVRVCDTGPEMPAVAVHDWAGGFKFMLTGPDAQPYSVGPVASEAAAAAALSAFGEAYSSMGWPAPLSAFAPGGRHYHHAFMPLLPTVVNVPGAGEAMLDAARKETEAGAKRVAPPATVPDAFSQGLEVFDVRPPAAVLAVLRSQNASAPVLIRRPVIGGPDHYLLAEGTISKDSCVSWSAGPDGSIVQDTWPLQIFRAEPAPDYLTARSEARLLN